MDIIKKRIPNTPRSKYYTNTTAITNTVQSLNGDYVETTGDQKIDGTLAVTGDIVAYDTNEDEPDIVLPIASSTNLGTVMIGDNLTIDEDGKLNAIATSTGTGTGDVNLEDLATVATTGSYNDLLNKPTLFNGDYNSLSNKPSLHSHSNLTYLNNINQYLSTSANVVHKSLACTEDVIAYSTGTAVTPFKYWKPYVSNGYLHWTNSTDTSTPASYYIKGDSGGTTTEDLATVATTGSYNDLLNKPSLFSGDYNDLSNKPSSTFTGGALTTAITYAALSGGGYTFTVDYTDAKYYAGTSISNNTHHQFYSQGGKRVQIGKDWNWTATNWTTGSDRRLKNITGEITNVLDKIKNVVPKYYTFKNNSDSLQLGIIAQDVKDNFPEFTPLHKLDETDVEYYTLDYASLGAVVAVQGCNELNKKIEDQQKEIDELKEKLNLQQSKIDALLTHLNITL